MESEQGSSFLFQHDLFRPSFARRSGLREGGNPVPTFRDHASTPYSLTFLTDWWKRSLRKYSSGSFGLTSAPSGTASQSTSLVSRKRMAAPRASMGSAARSAADNARTFA